MSDTIILEARNLSKHFGGLHAVDGVNLQVQAGAFHSVIGPNGAGKTTLFNLLSGVLHPTGGQILFRGREITGCRHSGARSSASAARFRSPTSSPT